MPRIHNGSMLVGAMFVASLGVFSSVANAQTVETLPPAAPQQTPAVESAATGAPVKAADESTAAFLARVNTTNPDGVSISAAELFKQSPTQAIVKDLVTIASSTDVATADITGKVTSGFPIIAVSTSAAQFSEQLSALILTDSGQLPTVVALAQKVGNKDFSEVVGEGLALAHATAMRNGNTILAAAIQLQTKGPGVPSDLLIAFSENIQERQPARRQRPQRLQRHRRSAAPVPHRPAPTASAVREPRVQKVAPPRRVVAPPQ